MGGRALILLDTHALIWLDRDDRRLGPSSSGVIRHAWDRNAVAVSAMSFWEAAMLAARRRVEFGSTVPLWRSELLRAGFVEIPVSGEIGIVAAELDGLHGDPADRLILATALAHDATLVTADRRLLDWQGVLQRLDARS